MKCFTPMMLHSVWVSEGMLAGDYCLAQMSRSAKRSAKRVAKGYNSMKCSSTALSTSKVKAPDTCCSYVGPCMQEHL